MRKAYPEVYDYSDAYQLHREVNPSRTVNVYIVDKLHHFSGFATLPNKSRIQYVFLDKGSFFSGSWERKLLLHELGHYFGLQHTFETRFGKELADGSNCETAGDLICDTPAEPYRSQYTIDFRCNYADTKRDSMGNLYRPDTRNFMSYVNAKCQESFTEQQLAVIRYYAEDFYRFNHSTCQSFRTDYSYCAPNPIQGNELRLFLKNDKVDTKLELCIIDVQGNKRQCFTRYKGQHDYNISLSVGNLPNGIYFLSVQYLKEKGEIDTFKFVKL
ncbi:MAG: zinc-dependent metalloprotease [Bacteroidota bacterium]